MCRQTSMSSAMFKVASRAMKSLYWSSLKSLVLALSQYRLFFRKFKPWYQVPDEYQEGLNERASLEARAFELVVSIRSLIEAGILSEARHGRQKQTERFLQVLVKQRPANGWRFVLAVYPFVLGNGFCRRVVISKQLTRRTMPQIIRSVALMCASSEIRILRIGRAQTVPPVPKTKRKSFMEGGYGRFGDGVLEEGSSEVLFDSQ